MADLHEMERAMSFHRIRGFALGCALSIQALLAAAQALPQGNTGIAARYPGDAGIAADPAVIFAALAVILDERI